MNWLDKHKENNKKKSRKQMKIIEQTDQDISFVEYTQLFYYMTI